MAPKQRKDKKKNTEESEEEEEEIEEEEIEEEIEEEEKIDEEEGESEAGEEDGENADGHDDDDDDDDDNAQSESEYLKREPAASSFFNDMKAKSTCVDFATRSIIEPLPRPSSRMTLQTQFDEAKSRAFECFNRVVAACKANGGKPFLDQGFFLGHRKNLYPDGTPDDCNVDEPKTIIRVEEFYKGAPLFSGNNKNKLDIDENDMVQGGIATCFFCGATSSLASFAKNMIDLQKKDPSFVNPLGSQDPIKRLFVAHDIPLSVYAVMFFGISSWEWVLIDGTLAGTSDRKPLYATCNPDDKELWPSLIEKAYGKFFGTLDNIDTGSVGSAISTLTGGAKLAIDCNRLSFDKLIELASDPLTVFGCAVLPEIAPMVLAQYEPDSNKAKGSTAKCGEESGPCNLILGHVYAVCSIKKTKDGRGFLRLRNTYAGAENGEPTSEWTGPFSDLHEASWAAHPTYKDELGFEAKEDGAFWMQASDFKNLMSLNACRFFPPTSTLLSASRVFDDSADDVYVLKINTENAKTAKTLPIILRQMSARFTPILLGENEQTHKMAKGKTDWKLASQSIGITVYYHDKDCPSAKAFKKTNKNKKTLVDVCLGWFSENLVMEVSIEPGLDGFVSVEVNKMAKGVPYQVNVALPATFFENNNNNSTNFVRLTDKETDHLVNSRHDDDEEKNNQQTKSAFKNEWYNDKTDDAWKAGEGSDYDDEEEVIGGMNLVQMRKSFDSFDDDHSGFLDKSECFVMILRYFPDASSSKSLQIMKDYDKNQDGKISFLEFKRILRAVYKK